MKSLKLYSTQRKAALRGMMPCAIGVLAGLAACGDSPSPPAPGVTDNLAAEGDASSYGKEIPIIVVVMDALNAAHITHLGYERDTTPHIDAFAKDGISYRAAFSPAPYTIAGIGALLSGRRPDSTGLYSNMNMMRDDEQPIAWLLSRQGYKTRAVISNPNGGMRFGTLLGFDEVSTLYEPAEDALPNFTTREGQAIHVAQAKEHIPLMQGFLDSVPEGEPFFYYSHMLEPHSPYIADEPFRSKYLDPDYSGVFLSGDTDDLLDTVYGRVEETAEDRAAITALYDGHLAFADHAFGQLMADLKVRGLYDKSLIILTGDHGEAMFQHGRWGHNDHIYDEMINVPLIFKLPGNSGPRGQVMEEIASTMDVLPTICEAIDIAPSELPLDGRSLYPQLISGEEDRSGRGLFLRTHHRSPDVGLRTRTHKGVLLRSEDGPAVFEFYDLLADPTESNNLGKTESAVLDDMRTQIGKQLAVARENWRKALRNSNPENDATTLGALGYTDEVNAAVEEDDSPFEDL